MRVEMKADQKVYLMAEWLVGYLAWTKVIQRGLMMVVQ